MQYIYHPTSSISHSFRIDSIAIPEEIEQMYLFCCQAARMLPAHIKQHLETPPSVWHLAARADPRGSTEAPAAPGLAPAVRLQGRTGGAQGFARSLTLCCLAIFAGPVPEPTATWCIQRGKTEGERGHFPKQAQLTPAPHIILALIFCPQMTQLENNWVCSSGLWCGREEGSWHCITCT